jgi:hypothetical protein
VIGLVAFIVLCAPSLASAVRFDQDPVRVTPGVEPETRTIYRAPKAGEQRVEGLLRRIECPAGRPVTFVLQLPDKSPAKYTAPSLASVDYIAHTPTFRGPVTCGGRTPPDRVYLTWMPSTKRVVAIEFLATK